MTTRVGARYDWWVRAVLVVPLVVLLVMALVIFAAGQVLGGAIMLGVILFDVLLFWFFLPQSYEIRPEGLRIVLGWPWRFNIPFDTVAEIHPGRGSDAVVFGGLRFSPSVKTPVVVRRSRGINVVISPQDRQKFMDAANEALSRYRERGQQPG